MAKRKSRPDTDWNDPEKARERWAEFIAMLDEAGAEREELTASIAALNTKLDSLIDLGGQLLVAIRHQAGAGSRFGEILGQAANAAEAFGLLRRT